MYPYIPTLIHIHEPTRPYVTSYAVFFSKKKMLIVYAHPHLSMP